MAKLAGTYIGGVKGPQFLRYLLEIRVDKVYKRVLFTEAKKRYARLLEDGTITTALSIRVPT